MDGPEAIVALFGMIGVFGVPLSIIWTHHKRKILELQLRLKQESDAGLRSTVEQMREEMRQLRDTTMQYDLSFDNALQRMEQRMEHLERRSPSVESETVANVRIGQ